MPDPAAEAAQLAADARALAVEAERVAADLTVITQEVPASASLTGSGDAAASGTTAGQPELVALSVDWS